MAVEGKGHVHPHAQEVIQADVKQTWRSYIWDSLDKSPEERRFLFKLDAAVLSISSELQKTRLESMLKPKQRSRHWGTS